MNLEEMLEFTSKQYLDDRTELIDGDDDSLWSDAVLVRLFNRAQKILCRRAWVLVEYGIAPAGVVVLATGKSLYKLHPSVLFVHDATPTTQTAPLGRAGDADLRNPYPPSTDAFDVGQAASIAGTTANTPGVTLAIATDAGSRMMRVAPEPAAAQNGTRVLLKITRLPIKFLTLDDPTACPEVPEDWHEDLCLYAAGKCLVMPNVDSGNKVDGRELLAEFDATVREARRDRQRAAFGNDRWQFSSTTSLIR